MDPLRRAPHGVGVGVGVGVGGIGFRPDNGVGSTRRNYLVLLALRRGRRANHQMLAIVATTPNAAAGLAILCERSGM